MTRLLPLTLLCSLALSCGSEGDDDKKRPAAAFERCERNADCQDGLFCAEGSPLEGHCAFGCNEDDQCQARFGASHACVEAVCVQVCGWLSECRDPESDDFESCGDGLTCRGDEADLCASLCTVPDWGDESRDEGFEGDDEWDEEEF